MPACVLAWSLPYTHCVQSAQSPPVSQNWTAVRGCGPTGASPFCWLAGLHKQHLLPPLQRSKANLSLEAKQKQGT